MHEARLLNQNFLIMPNVNIYGEKWLDLVFEGKNQAYGAYQLRREAPRRTAIAFFLGVLFIASLIGLFVLLSSFESVPKPPDEEGIVIDLTDITVPIQPEKPVEPNQPNTAAAPLKDVDRQNLVNPVLVDRDNEDNVAPNDEIIHDGPDNGTPNGIGTTENENPGKPGGGGTSTTPAAPTAPKGPYGTNMLDRMPEFPGGIQRFYDYVGRKFESPELNVNEITVIVSFVIETDGAMTDIKVLRNPGYGLDKEAIRVLKSLKTKWTPGVKDGQHVRTLYTLPIKVKL
jgi:protein TonB